MTDQQAQMMDVVPEAPVVQAEAPAVAQPPQDTSMRLSTEEMTKALHIKQAVQQQQPDDDEEPLQPLTDFDYVQFALCCGDERDERILQKIAALQTFKKDYKIHDTAEEGLVVLHQFTLQHPGVLLAIMYLPSSENYLSVIDWKAFIPAVVQTDEQWRILMAGLYYMFQSTLPQYQAIRQGCSCLAELEGLTSQNFDQKLFDQILHELYCWYPKKRKEIFLQNAPQIAVLAMKLSQRFLGDDFRASIQLGQHIPGLDGQRLDVLYKMPTVEGARLTMLTNFLELLTLRYANQKAFALPK